MLEPRRHPRPRLARGTGTSRLTASVAVASLASLVALGVLGPTQPATAVTRDVEVRLNVADDNQLRALPAVRLIEDAGKVTSWAVALLNGSDAALDLDLQVVFAQADALGRPEPSNKSAPWATLPRPSVTVPPKARVDFTIGLLPTAASLPAVVQLVASWSPQELSPVQVVATAVLLPKGTRPQVDLHIGEEAIVATSELPTVIDLRIEGRTWMRPTVTMDIGPLVLLANAPRSLDFATPRTLWGTHTEAVAAVAGVEVGRVSKSEAAAPGRVALVTAAALLLLVAAALAVKRLRSAH